jgi:hypothetical protein
MGQVKRWHLAYKSPDPSQRYMLFNYQAKCATIILRTVFGHGSVFTLPEQIEYARAYFAKSGHNVIIQEAEVLNV